MTPCAEKKSFWAFKDTPEKKIGSKRFCRDENGSISIEFAIALPVFLVLLVGIMEISWYFFQSGSLENAVLHASRYGITGRSESGITRQEQILDIIKRQTFGIIETDKLTITTEIYQQFDQIDVPEPFTDANDNGSFDSGEDFTDVNGNGVWDESLAIPGLGGGSDIVLYRLEVPYESLTGLFNWGSRFGTLSSTVAVRNEPY